MSTIARARSRGMATAVLASMLKNLLIVSASFLFACAGDSQTDRGSSLGDDDDGGDCHDNNSCDDPPPPPDCHADDSCEDPPPPPDDGGCGCDECTCDT